MFSTDGWLTTKAIVCSREKFGNFQGYDTWGEAIVSAPLVSFSYEVNGQTYTGEFRKNGIEAGDIITIRYDPAYPEQNDRSKQSTRSRLKSFAAAVVGIALVALYAWWEGKH